MNNHIYTTKAFIIKSISVGEANKIYFFLTKDLGFIKASAQGVRLGKSKLKGHLEVFSPVKISVVKGREVWRITSAESSSEKISSKDLGKLLVIKNIFSLLLRLLHGEEKNMELFDSIESVYNFVLHNELSNDDLKDIEAIAVLKILHNLGYFKKSSELSRFMENNVILPELITEFKSKRKQAIIEINEALKETHL